MLRGGVSWMRPLPYVPPILIAALILAAAPAIAHKHICIRNGQPFALAQGGHCETQEGDTLEFTVGWISEPPFTNLKNGIHLGVEWVSNETAITNLTTLNAQLEFGGKTFPLQLRPLFGRPGVYTDDVTPTRPGTYTLRVTGSAHGQAISFSEQIETVAPGSDIEFPEPSPDAAALRGEVRSLAQQVTDLQRQLADLRANGTAPARNGVTTGPGAGVPGFEAVAVAAALAVAVGVARRRAA